METMKYAGVYLTLQSAAERHNVDDFLKSYITICNEFGITAGADVIELLNSDKSDNEKSKIMLSEALRIQNTLKKKH